MTETRPTSKHSFDRSVEAMGRMGTHRVRPSRTLPFGARDALRTP